MSQLVDNHGDNDDAANDNMGVGIWDGQLAATAANGSNDQSTDHGSENGSAATAEASTTENNCGDDFQFLAGSVAGVSVLDVCKIEKSTDRHKEACNRVNGDHCSRDIDATKASGRFT